MSLSEVVVGGPHVDAHNEERAEINDLTDAVSRSLVLPEGTADGAIPRVFGGVMTYAPSRIYVPDWLACDGTDETSKVFNMIKAAVAKRDSTGQCNIDNPGLPIGITKPVYIPKNINLGGDGGGGDTGIGSRFVALGKEAQVTIAERGGKSEPWLFDGNGVADPTPHVGVVSTTGGSTSITVTSLDGGSVTDSALDLLWGKVIILSSSMITGAADGMYQAVIIATPGNAGYTGAASASGKLRLSTALPTGATATGVSAVLGESIWVHIYKPTQRQFDTWNITGSVASLGCSVDKISNATFVGFQVTKNRWDGLALGRNGAGGSFIGQTHIAGNGRVDLILHDDYGAATLSDSRNLDFDNLIVETLGAVKSHVVEHTSYDRVSAKQLTVTMNGVIPAFVNGANYSEIPQLNGVGNANVVDYNGHYYQVKKDSAGPSLVFTAFNPPDVDTAHWEDCGTTASLWHFGGEATAVAQVRNALTSQSTATQGNSANTRQYAFVGDSDSTDTPHLMLSGPWYKAGLVAGTLWNSTTAPIPQFAVVDESPTVPLIAGVGAANGWRAIPEPTRAFAAASVAATVTTSLALSSPLRYFSKAKLAVGRSFRCRLFGLNDYAAASGTDTVKLRANNTNIASLLLAVNQTAALAGSPWWADLEIVIDAIGSGGSMTVGGTFWKITSAAAAASLQVFTPVTTAVDLSSDLIFDLTTVFTVVSASNITRLTRGTLALNP